MSMIMNSPRISISRYLSAWCLILQMHQHWIHCSDGWTMPCILQRRKEEIEWKGVDEKQEPLFSEDILSGCPYHCCCCIIPLCPGYYFQTGRNLCHADTHIRKIFKQSYFRQGY